MDALEYLKAYALYANSVGKSVFPPTTNIYISNNGTTKTVEADDITVDGANVSIGGCVWNGTAWDFSNAGQSGGGGSSGGGVLVVHDVGGTLDKTWQEIADAGFAVCYVQPAFPIMPEFVYVLCAIKDGEDEPFVQFYCASGKEEDRIRQYTATSKNGYPVYN